MALGKAIGEFSLKSTSFTYTATGTGGTVQGNFEGSVKGRALRGQSWVR